MCQNAASAIQRCRRFTASCAGEEYLAACDAISQIWSRRMSCARAAKQCASKNCLADFARWREMAAIHAAYTTCRHHVLDESGYINMWQQDKSPDAPGRIENIKELITGMAEYESLPEFLEHVALVMENQDRRDGGEAVTIMTLHGAKGLEFDADLPARLGRRAYFRRNARWMKMALKGLEEERRLAYVGITRARQRGAYILCREPPPLRQLDQRHSLAVRR